MNHLRAFKKHTQRLQECRSYDSDRNIKVIYHLYFHRILDGNCYISKFCQASAEDIEAAGGQEIQLEAVQVMIGHQKVTF